VSNLKVSNNKLFPLKNCDISTIKNVAIDFFVPLVTGCDTILFPWSGCVACGFQGAAQHCEAEQCCIKFLLNDPIVLDPIARAHGKPFCTKSA
jgi:hypothetical protein